MARTDPCWWAEAALAGRIRRQVRRLAVALFTIAAVGLVAKAEPAPDGWATLRGEAENLGKPAWRPMLRYLAALHQRATHAAADPFKFEWEEIGPGYGYGPAFGHWDIVHAMLDVLPAWPAHVRRQLLNDLGLQLPGGFFPAVVWMPGAPGADHGRASFDTGGQSHPPVWPVLADDYMTLTGDSSVQRECFERAIRQIQWFETARLAKPDGFFYNDILLHKWESGVDEGVRFDGTQTGAKACVDATAHVYLLCDYAAHWARQLGEDDRPWRTRAERLAEFMRTRLWDERSGFFYDIWSVDDPAMQRAAWEGMWPMVVGAATPAEARRVIDEWVLNPRRFLTKHPLPSVAFSDAKFELRMWRGPTWNSMTYWTARGCVRYGRPDAARTVLEAALDDTAEQFARTGQIWEFYHPFGGHPEDVARKPQTKRNEPWTDYLGHNPLFAMARLWEQCAAQERRAP